jgi:hypothetical protein
MTKLIPEQKIESCGECPFAVDKPIRKESYCLQNHNIILEVKSIPSWCPLEDAPIQLKEWVQFRCPLCLEWYSGDDRHLHLPVQPCPDCGSCGKIADFRKNCYEIVDCPTCKGSGETYVKLTEPYPEAYPKVLGKCPICKGTGKEPQVENEFFSKMPQVEVSLETIQKICGEVFEGSTCNHKAKCGMDCFHYHCIKAGYEAGKESK